MSENIIASVFGLERNKIFAKSRQKKVITARFTLITLHVIKSSMYESRPKGFEDIAKTTGIERSNARKSVTKVLNWYQTDRQFKNAFDYLITTSKLQVEFNHFQKIYKN